MNDTSELLVTARRVVAEAAAEFASLIDPGRIVAREIHEREVKVAADSVLDGLLVAALRMTGIPVLSEESDAGGVDASGRYWLLDPLDGSYNVARSLGPAMIALCLMEAGQPSFGVLRDVTDGHDYWGGPGLGAFCDGRPIVVSPESTLSRSVLCTGFPSRFRVDDDSAMATQWRRVARFGKVRMIGSAAASLVRVARGSAEAYVESRIMSWDVAAGLALVEGAGGHVRADFSAPHEPIDVIATNGRVDPEVS